MHSREHEVALLVDMVRLSRVTLLVAEPESDKSALLQAAVIPLLNPEGTNGHGEIAILFDAWDETPLPALLARIRQAAAGRAAAVALPDPGSLAASLKAWQEALGVTFLIIFDRFEEYLRAPPDRTSIAEFEESFVQVVNDPAIRANFLLALDKEAEPLLARLRDRIPRLGYSRVRLPRASPAGPAEPAEHKVAHPEASPSLRQHDAGTPIARSGAMEEPAGTARKFESSIVAAAALRAQPQQHAAAHGPSKQPSQPDLLAAAATPSPTRPRAVEADGGVETARPLPSPDRTAAPKRGYTRFAWAALILIPAGLLFFWQPKSQDRTEPAQDIAVPTAPAEAETAVRPAAPEQPAAAQVAPDAASAPSTARPETLSPQVPPAPPVQTASRAPAVASVSELPTPEPAPPASNPPATVPATKPVPKPEVTASKPAAVTPAPAFAASPAVQGAAQSQVVVRGQPEAPDPPGSGAVPTEPVLHIHVRNEAQRAWAQRLIRPLNERGIRVAGIKVVPSGPDEADIRYYHLAERNEAIKVAVALRDFGLRTQQLKHVTELDTPLPARQYELWLPATGFDQQP